MTLQAIADRYFTSKQHVSRIVRNEQRQMLPPVNVNGPSVVSAVTRMLEDLGFDPEENVGGATALALAQKLDACRGAQSAQSAMASPGLAKALSEQLAALQGAAGDVGRAWGR